MTKKTNAYMVTCRSTRAETLDGGKARQSGRRYRNDTCEVYNGMSAGSHHVPLFEKALVCSMALSRYRPNSVPPSVYTAHSSTVTVAMFAPYNTAPGYKLDTEKADGEIIITADSNGRVNVLLALPPGEQARNAPWWAVPS